MSSALNAMDAATRADLRSMEAEANADLEAMRTEVLKDLRELGAVSPAISVRHSPVQRTGEPEDYLDDEEDDFDDDDEDLDAEARKLFGNAYIDRLNREADEANTPGLRIEFTEERNAELEREITLLRARQEERRKRR